MKKRAEECVVQSMCTTAGKQSWFKQGMSVKTFLCVDTIPCTLTHSTLESVLWYNNYYCPSFTDEELETNLSKRLSEVFTLLNGRAGAAVKTML